MKTPPIPSLSIQTGDAPDGAEGYFARVTSLDGLEPSRFVEISLAEYRYLVGLMAAIMERSSALESAEAARRKAGASC